MVNLGDDFTSSIDVAMSVRRLGLPGPRTPKGILTRFDGTPIGKLLSEIEEAATPELVGLGMLLLQLGSITANHINDGLKKMFRIAAADGLNHDFSVPAEQGKSGFTVHVNSLPEPTGALALGGSWKADPEMEKALAAWPRKALMPIESFSAGITKRKLGRNDLCSCGSGKKYKKCCLNK